MSIFGNAISTILGTRRILAGEAITYRRGATEIEITLATPLGGARPRDTTDSYTLAADELEWGIARSDLVDDDDNEITPADYDTIERTIAGRTLTYKVLPNEKNEKQSCWKWSDRAQTQYRIFTKLDSNVAQA